jgi:hypothetical protein
VTGDILAKPHLCPVCQGEGAISLDQAEALDVGKALGILTNPHIDRISARFASMIGDQVAEVLAEYQVQLVRLER